MEIEIEESALSPKIRALIADHSPQTVYGAAILQGSTISSIRLGRADLGLHAGDHGSVASIEVDREYDQMPSAAEIVRDIDAAITAIEDANRQERGSFLAAPEKSLYDYNGWHTRDTSDHIGWLSRHGDTEIIAAIKATETEAKRRNAERAATEAADKATKEARRAAAIEARDTWIREHGSSRLQRLLAEDIPLWETYRDERLALERPGWRWETDAEETNDLRDASEAALDALDAARASGVSDAKLAWLKIAQDEDECEESREILSADFLGYPIVREIS